MSSNEDEYNDGENSAGGYQKKRRIQRACDICRRKKIRCDGVQMPGNKCSNCIAYSFDCTYVETAKKRGPPKGYVETLENRVERLEKLLRRLCPDEDSYKKLTESLDSNWMSERPPADPSELIGRSLTTLASGPSHYPGKNTTVGIDYATTSIRHAANEPMSPPDVEDETTLILADNLQRLELEPSEYRFFGKSSGAMLIHAALELKSEYTGSPDLLDIVELSRKRKMMKNLRSEFWTSRPWEKSYSLIEKPKYTFPEPDLSKHLVDLYFDCVNLYLPLLHRPTFEKWINEGLHLSNDQFAPVYLLVLAVGARYSSDPRAMLDGIDSYHSCGWKWFDQVQMMKRSMLSPPTLFDIQCYCLAVQFLQGSSAPQSCWTLVGIGIRLAQDVGAHRRKINSHKMTAEDELWKRAFWVLVCVDRMVSSSLGRPCAIQDEDFDLDLPFDCDDEFWDNPDPEQRFKQPAGKPSMITFFILYLKLHQILAFSLRTIYSINKSKVLLGFIGSQWEQHIVAELDSALNKWVDTVPDHLRWDPSREDDQCFAQSVALYSAYYHIQILVHRPFIPSPSKPSPLSFPSLAICTNAARSCCHVVDIQRKRTAVLGKAKPPHMMATPQIQMSVFTSGIVLLLSIWGGKRSGLSTDPNREMAEVHKCMNVLRDAEQRWHSAGRLWDILYELASVGDLPLPQYSPPMTNKRERDAETPISRSSADLSSPSPPESMPRSIAGSRRVHKENSERAAALRHGASSDRISSCDQPSHGVDRSPSQAQIKHEVGPAPPPHIPVQYYSLPVYSNELGRLPLHGQVAFSSDASVHPVHAGPQRGAGYWPPQQQQPPLGSINVANGSGSGMRLNPGPAGIIDGPGGAGYPSLDEMSSMTAGFEMDAAAMAAGMMLDTMAGTLSYGQHVSQPNPPPGMGYGIIGMEGPTGGSMDGYRGLAMDTTGLNVMGNDASGSANRARPSGQQLGHAGLQGQGQQQDMSYQFVDNDTIAMWSTAPTGFELDEWGTYLTNVSELTQHTQQTGGTGDPGGNSMHQSHLT